MDTFFKTRFACAIFFVILFGAVATPLHAQTSDTTATAPPDSTVVASQTGIIEGEVIDKITKQEVIGARIELIGTTIGALSDLTGKFRLTNLPPKTYQLSVTAPDYKPLIRSDVAVSTAQSVMQFGFLPVGGVKVEF